MSNRILCEVFRSPRKEGMYLYVDKTEGMKRVPDALLALFGKPQAAMTVIITPDKTLARADAEAVMTQIREKGFYLQLPPEPDQDMLAVSQHNSKLQC